MGVVPMGLGERGGWAIVSWMLWAPLVGVLFISPSIHIYIYVYTQSPVWLYIRRVAQITFRFDKHFAWFETFRNRSELESCPETS